MKRIGHLSALCNVGLGVGYLTAASPFVVNWVFIVLMWLGRPEIVPVLIMILGLFKGVGAIIAK